MRKRLKGNILLFTTLIILLLSTILTSMSILIKRRLDLAILKSKVNPTYAMAESILESYIENIEQNFKQELYQYISTNSEFKNLLSQKEVNQAEIQNQIKQAIENEVYSKFIENYVNKSPIKIMIDNTQVQLSVSTSNAKNEKMKDQFYAKAIYATTIDKTTKTKHTIEALVKLALPKTISYEIYKTFQFKEKPSFLDYALWIDGPILLNDVQSLNANIEKVWTREPIVTLEQYEALQELGQFEEQEKVEETFEMQFIDKIIPVALESHQWRYEMPIEIGKSEINLSDYVVIEDIETPHITLIINTDENETLKISADEEPTIFYGWIFSKGPVEIITEVMIEGGLVAPMLIIDKHLQITGNSDKLLAIRPYDLIVYKNILETLGIELKDIDSYLKIDISEIGLEIESLYLKS